MKNKELLDELHKIGKLPSEDEDCDNFPFDEFETLIKQVQLPLDFDTVIKLINLSPPIDTGCFGMEWTLVHLIEKYENYDEDFQKIMDESEEGEVKNMLRTRMENYEENRKAMQLSEKFHKNDSCNRNVIKKVEEELGKVFPKDYVYFLFWSNGGEGEIGENYISFWRCEDIAQLNKDYGIQKYLTENFVAFGTDGGSECYAFDYSVSRNPKIVNCSLGDLDINELRYMADTFTEFAEILKHRKIE